MIDILNDKRMIKSITTSQDRFYMTIEGENRIYILPHRDEYGLWFLVWVNGIIERRVNSSFVTEIEY